MPWHPGWCRYVPSRFSAAVSWAVDAARPNRIREPKGPVRTARAASASRSSASSGICSPEYVRHENRFVMVPMTECGVLVTGGPGRGSVLPRDTRKV